MKAGSDFYAYVTSLNVALMMQPSTRENSTLSSSKVNQNNSMEKHNRFNSPRQKLQTYVIIVDFKKEQT